MEYIVGIAMTIVWRYVFSPYQNLHDYVGTAILYCVFVYLLKLLAV